MAKITTIILHHTAVSRFKNPDQFNATNNYHKSIDFPRSSLGYYVGYNYEIAADGKTRQARLDGEITAAVPQEGMNTGKAIHICLDGYFDIEMPAPEQIYALRDLLKELFTKHGELEIKAHHDFSPKTCPGRNIDMDFIRSLVVDKTSDNNLKKDMLAETKQLLNSTNKLIDLISKMH